MDIKPIETHYNGYRFRSRLEARWAVFFDAAEIKYEYEPEGFVIESYGEAYLPDFFLPRFKTYVEIKHGNLSEEDIYKIEDKCQVFKMENPDVAMLICYGDPHDMKMRIFYDVWHEETGRYLPCYGDAHFVEGAGWLVPYLHQSGKLALKEEYRGGKEIYIAVENQENETLDCILQPSIIYLHAIRRWRSFLQDARKKARYARFEHGEKP